MLTGVYARLPRRSVTSQCWRVIPPTLSVCDVDPVDSVVACGLLITRRARVAIARDPSPQPNAASPVGPGSLLDDSAHLARCQSPRHFVQNTPIALRARSLTLEWSMLEGLPTEGEVSRQRTPGSRAFAMPGSVGSAEKQPPHLPERLRAPRHSPAGAEGPSFSAHPGRLSRDCDPGGWRSAKGRPQCRRSAGSLRSADPNGVLQQFLALRENTASCATLAGPSGLSTPNPQHPPRGPGLCNGTPSPYTGG